MPMLEQEIPRATFSINANVASIYEKMRKERYPGWRPAFVVANLGVSLFMVGASLYVVERLCRRTQRRMQFGVRFLLVATACVATFIAIERAWKRPWEVAIADAALGTAAIGVLIAWIGFFDIVTTIFDILAVSWNALGAWRGARIVYEPEAVLPERTSASPVSKPR